MTITYNRDGRRYHDHVVPEADKVTDCTGKEKTIGRLRIRPASVTEFRSHDILGAMGAGVRHVWSMTTMFYTSMAQIVTAARPVDELGGPIRIAKAAGEASYGGWVGILQLVIALSVVLGVFNLLPVPMLDGGHLAMYLYEAVRGQPLGVEGAGGRAEDRLRAGDRHGACRHLQRHQVDSPPIRTIGGDKTG